jgi:3-deoxy-D-manno-octulosonate 8-phosphate phosphatase (KDO 8-P phosphatase)
MASRTAAAGALRRKARAIELAVFDVDGVMTDGRLYVGPGGQELKAVHIHDGHGLKLLQRAGIRVAVISGRRSEAMEWRLGDLGVQQVFMGVADKLAIFLALLKESGLDAKQAAYMGDDEPDLAPMRLAGLAMTVPDAMPVVKRVADWTSRRAAGAGAVREACELLLSARSVTRSGARG